MITNTITAQRGTHVSTSRPASAAFACASDRVRTDVWAAVRPVDGDTTAMGHSAWSPPT